MGRPPPTPVENTTTWRDPSFGDLGYGFGPENELIGTQYQANSVDLAMKVNADEGNLRFWRDSTAAGMRAGMVATLSDHTIGYESNEDVDNGYRPAGLIHLSTTTGPTAEYSVGYGRTVVQNRTTTHNATLYRAGSTGGLVFSAGTVQWAWGLDSHHDGAATPSDSRMRQATLNVLRDMGAAGATVAEGLVAPSPSTDVTPPTVAVTAPAAGSTVSAGSLLTVSGTATDVGGRVAGVEVSVDGGATFEPADGTASWTYTGVLTGNGASAVQVRATDDSIRTSAPVSVALNTPCPCSLFGLGAPSVPDGADDASLTLGVRFSSSTAGFINGVRFYKDAANTGTHQGFLYSPTGQVMASGTFTEESVSGWQNLVFPQSVPVDAGATYTVAYTAPNGHYAADKGYFETRSRVSGVLTAQGGRNVVNGVFYRGTGFPTETYKYTNYWVDAIWSPTDTSPVVVSTVTPAAGATSVATSRTMTATFNKAIDPGTLMLQVTDPEGNGIPGATTYDATTRRATFNPTQGLAPGTTYTATVNAGGLAAAQQWTFTTAKPDAIPNVCPCSIFNEADQPAAGPDPDTKSVQLGTAFTTNASGSISGIRFYKNVENGGAHTVTLWKPDGSKAAEATSVSESPSGWQEVSFTTPVPVSSGSTYVASYRAPQGRYAYTPSGLASKVTNGPLSTVVKGGRYSYGDDPLTSTSNTNYFADPVFNPAAGAPPSVRRISPGNGATSVPVDAHIQANFDSDIQPGSAVVTVKRSSDGAEVAGAVGTESQGSVVSFVASGDLDPATRYTVVVSGAQNLAGTAMASSYTASFTTSGAAACPCSLMESTSEPSLADSGDTAGVTVGLKFTASVNGFVKGLRYYRDVTNTGPHTGTLWSSPTDKLATLTFADGPAGWTTTSFASSVPVTAGTTYVASYYAPTGHYSADLDDFDSPRVNTPLASAGSGGVFTYSNGYPNESYRNSNYYVDVLFTTADDDPPTVSGVTPSVGATAVATSSAATATFARAIDSESLSFTVTDPAGQLVGGQRGYDAASRTATFTTGAPLAAGTTYTATVSANSSSGVAMPTAKTWTFTTADDQPPALISTNPAAGATGVPGNRDGERDVRPRHRPDDAGAHAQELGGVRGGAWHDELGRSRQHGHVQADRCVDRLRRLHRVDHGEERLGSRDGRAADLGLHDRRRDGTDGHVNRSDVGRDQCRRDQRRDGDVRPAGGPDDGSADAPDDCRCGGLRHGDLRRDNQDRSVHAGLRTGRRHGLHGDPDGQEHLGRRDVGTQDLVVHHGRHRGAQHLDEDACGGCDQRRDRHQRHRHLCPGRLHERPDGVGQERGRHDGRRVDEPQLHHPDGHLQPDERPDELDVLHGDGQRHTTRPGCRWPPRRRGRSRRRRRCTAFTRRPGPRRRRRCQRRRRPRWVSGSARRGPGRSRLSGTTRTRRTRAGRSSSGRRTGP